MTPYYHDESCSLYLGKLEDVLPRFLDGAFQHVICDPPYETHVHTNQRQIGGPRGELINSPIEFDPISEELRAFFGREAGRLVKRWVLTFCQIEAAMLWSAAFEVGGLKYHRTCIWRKPDGKPNYTGNGPGMGYETIVAMHKMGVGRSTWNGGGRHGVFTHNKSEKGRKRHLHQTQKPLGLMHELVTLFTDPGEVILDPFAGSGTTLVAARDLGRLAVGVEQEERYCEIAAERLSQGCLTASPAAWAGGA